MSLSPSIDTKLLDNEHPDYKLYKEAWNNLALLSAGGAELKKHASEFLAKRPKEPIEVYNERLKKFAAQNFVGAGVKWYTLAMFRNPPDVYLKDENDKQIENAADGWYDTFQKDCDRSGGTLVDFFKRAFANTLLFGRYFILEDLAADAYDPNDPPKTLAEQRAAGGLDPYLVGYDPRQALNWSVDRYGNLEWIVFKTTEVVQTFADKPKTVDRWYYFDTEECAVYEAERKDSPNQEENKARLLDGYPKPHAATQEQRVPVRVFEVPEGLWLGDRVYLDVMEHVNMRNAYFWGLFMACLPVLVVKGGFLTDPTISEVGYLAVEKGSEVDYIEPSGTSYERVSAELSALREEIYRQMYLQAQGRNSTATASAASGYSKEMDMAPAVDVLNGLGDILKAMMQLVLGDVAEIRGDAVIPDVNGFQFDDLDEAKELSTAQISFDLDIPSDRLRKEQQKQLARMLLRGRNPELITEVEQEIDTAPTKSEIEAQQQAQQQQQIAAAVQSADNKFVGSVAKP